MRRSPANAGHLTSPRLNGNLGIIGMKNGALDAVTTRPDGHVQTGNNQFSTHVIGRGPAQRPLGMLVLDRIEFGGQAVDSARVGRPEERLWDRHDVGSPMRVIHRGIVS